MLSTLRRTLFALLACASFIVHAAAPDEITTAWPVNVGPLNPHLYTPNQMFAQSMVYEPLVKYQADGSVIPWLAKSWTHSEDGKTWTFTLREENWVDNNGEVVAPVTAQDFVDALQYVLTPDYASSNVGLVTAYIAGADDYYNYHVYLTNAENGTVTMTAPPTSPMAAAT